MIEYYVVPGYVTSKYDGDIHYIDGPTLIRLYNVDPNKCKILNTNNRYDTRLLQLVDTSKIKVLEPRYHGDYNDSIL